jgi:hypothetical protein
MHLSRHRLHLPLGQWRMRQNLPFRQMQQENALTLLYELRLQICHDHVALWFLKYSRW